MVSSLLIYFSTFVYSPRLFLIHHLVSLSANCQVIPICLNTDVSCIMIAFFKYFSLGFFNNGITISTGFPDFLLKIPFHYGPNSNVVAHRPPHLECIYNTTIAPLITVFSVEKFLATCTPTSTSLGVFHRKLKIRSMTSNNLFEET